MKNNFAGVLIGGIFTLVGATLLAGMIFILVYSSNMMRTCDAVDAEITQIDESNTDSDSSTSHKVHVSYRYEGTDYRDIEISYYSSSMYEGKSMTVYIDQNNPYKVHIKESSTISSCILGILGGVFAFIGVIFIIMTARGNRRRSSNEKTDTNGVKKGGIKIDVMATITGFEKYTENGLSYRIACEYQDDFSGLIYVFYSRYMTTDPAEVYSVGELISVSTNAESYANYVVDTSKIDNYQAGIQQ